MTQTAEGTFNPAFHFLGLIQKTIADGITRHCVHPGCPEVYLVPTEHTYYTATANIDALTALCLAAPFDLNVELLPDWRPPAATKDNDVQAGRMLIHRKTATSGSGLVARPLSELMWFATLSASNGQLLQGCHADVAVRLKEMPDFSRFYHRGYDLVLADFLLKKRADLPTAAQATGIPLPHVFEFYNACVVVGLIEQGNVFEPAHYLLGLLDKANADKQSRSCALTGSKPLIIVPNENKYYTELDLLGIAKLCSTLLAGMEVSIVDHNQDKEEVVQIGRTRVRRKVASALPLLPSHPLADLLFRAALYASQGRLLYGYDLDTPVRLHDWPSKTLLRESATVMAERYIFPLTAFMTANPAMSLPDIAKATQQSLAKVIDFHNACAVLGLLEHPA
jgi:hypothetical protein